MYRVKIILLLALVSIFFVSCDSQHSGYISTEYTGDYRVYAGIAEFFDCEEEVKYYVADLGVYSELAEKYAALGLPDKEDAYLKVEGYLKKEAQQIDGVEPIKVFVPTKFIGFDETRGCRKGKQVGV